MFVLLDQTNEMRSYEAVFGDLEGRRLVCVKRHLSKQFWKDGYYFCTYQPNWRGQQPLSDRDVDNKRVYPFSYMQVTAMKGRFFYRLFNHDQKTGPPRLMAENPWMGFMVVCCTPAVRMGKWAAKFKRATTGRTTIHVDQWKNTVQVGPGNDLLAALCMAYIFDRYQCQPFVTVFGRDSDDEYEPEDKSIESEDGGYHDEDSEEEDEDDDDDDSNDDDDDKKKSRPASAGEARPAQKGRAGGYGDVPNHEDDNHDDYNDNYEEEEDHRESGSRYRDDDPSQTKQQPELV